ncbi:2-phospho-L-lactate guanylyltransferase [Streptacidiphilus sp. PB12-B1b]|uniref:2-phospho-L-lactate guanylyltransferase n=1 Tax=Streptacidiphilus sp. PB12-B1b TaxID=2705012 RepID=UPI001CDD8CFF|nr:2-phospho-L-lactate guanylyltransferase [Streptacidiphilus sp. PB12-B1b]
MPSAARPGAWSLVLPLKPLALAKSRLAQATGELRPGLALAFALDTAAAALECAEVGRLLVVTDDPVAGAELAALGALVVPDAPAAGLNAALRHGAAVARTAHGAGPVAAMSADLPALRPAELGRVLRAAAGHPRAFLADTQGVGTTLLAAAAGVPLGPAFGGASRLRHAASGARELTLADVPSLRRDVDTPDDLRTALELGAGPRTASLSALVALGPRHRA